MATRSEKEEMLEFLSQKGNFELVINSNMIDLCQRTVNILELSAYLRFDSNTIAQLMHPPSAFEKAMNLYLHMLRTVTNYSKVLEALEETGNEHVLRLLLVQIQRLKVPNNPTPGHKPGFSDVCMVYAGTNNETTPRLGILQLLAMVYLPAPPPPPIIEPSLPASKINETTSPLPQQQLLASGPGPASAPNFENDFFVPQKLGRGDFSLVYEAALLPASNEKKDPPARGTCAIKIIPLVPMAEKKFLEREVALLEDLKGVNDPRKKFIVRIEKYWREPKEGIVKNSEEFLKAYKKLDGEWNAMKRSEIKGLFFIQMELCLHGNLEFWVHQNNIEGTQTSEKVEQCQRWFTQIIEGVTLLHSLGIWHRDLKLANIVLAKEEDPLEIKKGNTITAKIADFGLSRYRPFDDEVLTGGTGTWGCRSPEVRAGSNYSEKADIYSLGVILVNLLRPKSRLQEGNKYKLDNYDDFMKGGSGTEAHIVPQEFSTNFPAEAKMAERMLKKDPKERPSAEELLEWCKSPKFIKNV